MEHLVIRGETPEDYGAIRSLIVETFRAAYGTGALEADLIEMLRDQSAFGVAQPITGDSALCPLANSIFTPCFCLNTIWR